MTATAPPTSSGSHSTRPFRGHHAGHPRSPSDSDADLISRVRSGDGEAFGVLFERHREMAQKMAAAQLDNRADVDDVVADAFTSVYQSLAAGKGPDTFFRAYLLTTVRRVAYKANQAGSRIRPTAESYVIDSVEGPHDPVLAEFESTTVAQAFKALPERWQAVLWYVDIEGMKPADASAMLGLSPNGVSSLAIRARERLRQIYLQNHINTASGDSCEEYASQLGAFARGGLRSRLRERIQTHLEDCPKCTAVLLELDDVQGAMRAVIFPLIAGVAFTPAIPALTAATTGTPVTGIHGVLKSMPAKIGVGVLTAVAVTAGAAVAMGMTGASKTGSPTATVTASDGALASAPSAAVPAKALNSPAPRSTEQPSPFAPATHTPPRGLPAFALPKTTKGQPPAFPNVSKPAQLPAAKANPVPATAIPTLPITLPPLPPTVPKTTTTMLPTPSTAAAPVPTPAPTSTATPPASAQATATFNTGAGTTAVETNATITFSLPEGTVPASAEAIFTISENADMIPGKLIEPPGWTCKQTNLGIRQFHCTSTTLDPHSLTFALTITQKATSQTATLTYQFSGTGLQTATFSNTF
nr:sigma-70 family RNA polymerase sigma factor [Arthrobacter sp. efr-133-TYG-104]